MNMNNVYTDEQIRMMKKLVLSIEKKSAWLLKKNRDAVLYDQMMNWWTYHSETSRKVKARYLNAMESDNLMICVKSVNVEQVKFIIYGGGDHAEKKHWILHPIDFLSCCSHMFSFHKGLGMTVDKWRYEVNKIQKIEFSRNF